jgi:hypothetical protein
VIDGAEPCCVGDRYLKNDESRSGYLDVAVAESTEGTWPAAPTPAAGLELLVGHPAGL